MVIREDGDLNVCINQYQLIKEISVGINSRVFHDHLCSVDIYMLLSK